MSSDTSPYSTSRLPRSNRMRFPKPQRLMTTILAAFLLSGQVFASMPGACGCCETDSAIEPSCCADQPSCGEFASPDDDCCCGDRCGEAQTSCECGCGSDSENQPVRTEESRAENESSTIACLPVGELEGQSNKRCHPCALADSNFVSPISLQILFCIWQT